MRAFIAIPLNDEVREKLSGLQCRLRQSNADIKWVNPENIHLTLKFLSEIEKDKVPAISSALKKAFRKYHKFDISVSGIGAFPDISRPRIIWAGINDEKSQCVFIQKTIDACLEKIGIAKEDRPFFPHLTLGRARSGKNIRELIGALKTEKDFSIKAKIHVNKLVLFSSALTPNGPIYKSLDELLLV
jgi:RNA 2',3'-cyclic 3'-phosphodiesterase